MLLRDCPGIGASGWEYEEYQDHDALLPVRCHEWLVSLRTGQLNPKELSINTRAAHLHLFNGLTPDECDYFAGHYRGEDFLCLKPYNVHIASDPRVGVDASVVFNDIKNLKEAVDSGMAAIGAAYKLPNAQLPQWQKILYLVTFSTRILVEFLRIHPYANGNGHMARFIIFLLLAQYGIWPKEWPFDESPPYHQLISDYRNGSPKPLEEFIMRSILGSS